MGLPASIQSTATGSGAASRMRARTRPSPCCSRSMCSVNVMPMDPPRSNVLRCPWNPSNSPSGRTSYRLSPRTKRVNEFSPANSPVGRLERLLPVQSSSVNADSPAKMSPGRETTGDNPTTSLVSPLNPAKSPLRTERIWNPLITCPSSDTDSNVSRTLSARRWAGVISRQWDTPGIRDTRRSRICAERLQTSVAMVTLNRRLAVSASRSVAVRV